MLTNPTIGEGVLNPNEPQSVTGIPVTEQNQSVTYRVVNTLSYDDLFGADKAAIVANMRRLASYFGKAGRR